MKINELNNEEVLFINYILQQVLSGFNTLLEDKGIHETLDSQFGPVTIFKEFTEQELEKITTSDKLRIVKSITDKFGPISDMISESDPELHAKINNMLDSEDESEDEDM